MDRRTFLQFAAAGLGTAGAAGAGVADSSPSQITSRKNRLPREVWVASLSLDGLDARDYKEMTQKVLRRMGEIEALEPDIVCLPETFPFMRISQQPHIPDVAEVPPGPISSQIAEFARTNHCYVICPIYTKHAGRYYNSAVVIDREGKPMGEYHKIRPTEGEVEQGITPGPLEPPVFKTDFGTIGVQICFDINWHDGWRRLRSQGAEMVFWPSAFCGGTMVNAMAWINKYYVISSTRFDPTKICDITGQEIQASSRGRRWVCEPLNLEKAFIHGWPYWQRYNDVQRKYGQAVRIKHFQEEGWSTIESRSPDLRIADVLKEFEIKTHEEHIAGADAVQVARRPA